jgi:hypothetical protein
MDFVTAATMDGMHGTLRTRRDGSRVWEGDLEGEAVARLLRRAMTAGGVAFEVGGVATRVRVQEFHFDAGRGRIVVELGRPPT